MPNVEIPEIRISQTTLILLLGLSLALNIYMFKRLSQNSQPIRKKSPCGCNEKGNVNDDPIPYAEGPTTTD